MVGVLRGTKEERFGWTEDVGCTIELGVKVEDDVISGEDCAGEDVILRPELAE